LATEAFASRDEMFESAVALAGSLARKDAFAVRGTKHVLLHARDNSVRDSLEYVKAWNTAMLKKENVAKAIAKAKL